MTRPAGSQWLVTAKPTVEASPLELWLFWGPAAVAAALGFLLVHVGVREAILAHSPVFFTAALCCCLTCMTMSGVLLMFRAPSGRTASSKMLAIVGSSWLLLATAAVSLAATTWQMSTRLQAVGRLLGPLCSFEVLASAACGAVCAAALVVVVGVAVCCGRRRVVGNADSRREEDRPKGCCLATATGFSSPAFELITATRSPNPDRSPMSRHPMCPAGRQRSRSLRSVEYTWETTTDVLRLMARNEEAQNRRDYDLVQSLEAVNLHLQRLRDESAMDETPRGIKKPLPCSVEAELDAVSAASALAAVCVEHNVEELYHDYDLLEIDDFAVALVAGEDGGMEDGEIRVNFGTASSKHHGPVSTTPLANLPVDQRVEELNKRCEALVHRALQGLPLTDEEVATAKRFHNTRGYFKAIAEPFRTPYLTPAEKDVARRSPALLAKVWRYAQCLRDGRHPQASVSDEWSLEPLSESDIQSPRREIRSLLGHKRDIFRQQMKA